ncbi:MAG: 4-(cytidine 5'-diphospho)-2-C-methyl-D-erythritol kinase [Acidobacteriota bacterium]
MRRPDHHRRTAHVNEVLTVPSFAKINWILKILGKRPDGYHEVSTLLQTIDLRDQIHVFPRRNEGIQIEVEGRPVPSGEGNLLYRAAALFGRRAGIDLGVCVRLHKRIPVGAGLGGGSGNAAVLLLCLNQIWNGPLDKRHLAEIGADIGADVAFFLSGGTALGEGRGERITPLPDPPPEKLLLIFPGLHITSKEAYAAGGWGNLPPQRDLRLTKRKVDTKIQRFREKIESGRSVRGCAENDFEVPILKRYPLLAEIKKSLGRAGCERVILCGSGSSILGLGEPRRVVEVADSISRQGLGEVFLCRSLSRSHYRNILRQSGLHLSDFR